MHEASIAFTIKGSSDSRFPALIPFRPYVNHATTEIRMANHAQPSRGQFSHWQIRFRKIAIMLCGIGFIFLLAAIISQALANDEYLSSSLCRIASWANGCSAPPASPSISVSTSTSTSVGN
jgi:hypothetical protein